MKHFTASDRDVSRAVRSWLLEDRREDASRISGAVLDRADTIRQRRARWWPVRRTPAMARILGVGVAVAAVAIVAGVLLGTQLFGAPTNVGGPPALTTPEPTPSPTPSPTPTLTPAAGRLLAEGPFLVEDVAAPVDAPRITVTVPAPGWTSLPEYGGLLKGPDDDPPLSAMLLWSWPAGTTFHVYGDPCHWESSERTQAGTVDELAAALAAQPSRDGSNPVDVSVDGYAGKRVTLHVPEDWDHSSNDCDEQNFASYGVNGGGEPSRYHQGPGQIDELWILDVDGSFAILNAMYRPDTPSELVEEMRGIIESATFEIP